MLYMISVKNSLLLCHLKTLEYDFLEFVRDIILVVCHRNTSLTSCAFQNIDNASVQRCMIKQCDFLIRGHFFSFAFNSDHQVYSQMGQVHITSFREREKKASNLPRSGKLASLAWRDRLCLPRVPLCFMI